jgi:hypothetical protein
MVNDFLGLGFTDLGIEQGRVPSFREFFMTAAAAQQTKAIFSINLANGEIGLSWAPNMLAIGIDTG